jgi:hypothetical protein
MSIQPMFSNPMNAAKPPAAPQMPAPGSGLGASGRPNTGEMGGMPAWNGGSQSGAAGGTMLNPITGQQQQINPMPLGTAGAYGPGTGMGLTNLPSGGTAGMGLNINANGQGGTPPAPMSPGTNQNSGTAPGSTFGSGYNGQSYLGGNPNFQEFQGQAPMNGQQPNNPANNWQRPPWSGPMNQWQWGQQGQGGGGGGAFATGQAGTLPDIGG